MGLGIIFLTSVLVPALHFVTASYNFRPPPPGTDSPALTQAVGHTAAVYQEVGQLSNPV